MGVTDLVMGMKVGVKSAWTDGCSVRVEVVMVAVVVPGIWRWIAIVLGVFLPYIAVVMVNAVRVRGTPDDPNYFVPDHRLAIEASPDDRPVIRPDL